MKKIRNSKNKLLKIQKKLYSTNLRSVLFIQA